MNPEYTKPYDVCTSPFFEWIDLAAAGLGVLMLAVFLPGQDRSFAFIGYGLLWLAIAWKSRLSAVLVVLLLGVASRMQLTRDIVPGDLWILGYALGVWGASVWIPARFVWMGWVLGAAWGLLLFFEPALWLTALCMLPRLVTLNPGRERAVSWSAALVGGGIMIWAMVSGLTEGLFLRPGETSTYDAILSFAQTVFSAESLLLVIGLTGLFELAQPMSEEHSLRWRNVALFGVPLAFLFLEPGRAMTAALWVGFPAAAVLLTRWTLALPHLAVRCCLWAGFLFLLGVSV